MSEAPKPRQTARYRQRRDAILVAAVRVLNRRGVRGMTLKDVAAQLGIVPTGVIYYFPNKEALAAACFQRAIAHYQDLFTAASSAPTPEARVDAFLQGYLKWHARMREGDAPPIAVFNDVRALNDPAVNEAFVAMYRRLRSLLDDEEERAPRSVRNARTHFLLSTVFWAVVWLQRYDPDDYGRILARIREILFRGVAAADLAWPPQGLAPLGARDRAESEGGAEQFLGAATQLINEEGYFGASVDRITARLNLTKGAFYHHIDTKDDLVVACFEHTLALMRAGQRAGMALDASAGDRLSAAAAGLVEYQLAGDAPLLRTSALTSVPEVIQDRLLLDFERITRRFAGLLNDGIADGSLRPVDVNIASDMLTGLINAAAELRFWVPGITAEQAPERFIRPFFHGLLSSQEA